MNRRVRPPRSRRQPWTTSARHATPADAEADHAARGRVVDDERSTEERGDGEAGEADRSGEAGASAALDEQVGAQEREPQPGQGHQEERELRRELQLHLGGRHLCLRPA